MHLKSKLFCPSCTYALVDPIIKTKSVLIFFRYNNKAKRHRCLPQVGGNKKEQRAKLQAEANQNYHKAECHPRRCTKVGWEGGMQAKQATEENVQRVARLLS